MSVLRAPFGANCITTEQSRSVISSLATLARFPNTNLVASPWGKGKWVGGWQDVLQRIYPLPMRTSIIEANARQYFMKHIQLFTLHANKWVVVCKLDPRREMCRTKALRGLLYGDTHKFAIYLSPSLRIQLLLRLTDKQWINKPLHFSWLCRAAGEWQRVSRGIPPFAGK